MFATLRLKLYAALAFLGIAAVAWMKYLAGRLERAERERDIAKAGLKRKVETEERETEIESDWSDRERAAHENLDDIPDFLRKRRGMHDDTD